MKRLVPLDSATRGAAALLVLAALLTGCGGGGDDDPIPTGPTITQFSAETAIQYVGEPARLRATFSHGTGRIEPGAIAVTSGQTITTLPLTQDMRYELFVTRGDQTVRRHVDLTVRYRERMRTIQAPFARAEHAAVRLYDGRVLILGGEAASVTLPEAMYVFDARTESFARFGSLSSGRVAFTATSLNDGNVLVTGGLLALQGAPAAEIIDGATGAVRATTTGPIVHRYYAAATLMMDGKVLFTGGMRGAVPDATAEIYDPTTGVFTLLPGTLHVARGDHSMVRIDERRFFIYGGITLDGQPAPPEIFDAIAGTSTLLISPETIVRYRHLAHTMSDGTIVLVGGEDADGTPLASVLRFNPASSRIEPALNLATARSSAALGRLSDGRILVTGGTMTPLSTSATATTELISALAQRNNGPDMSAKRQMHTVTSLSNGKVLIFGGLDEHARPLAVAEIFE